MDVEQFAKKLINEAYKAGQSAKPVKREFSKNLMIFASVMYAVTWVVLVLSWFIIGEMPEGIKTYATWLYGAVMGVYGAKAYGENRLKIQNGKDDEK